MLKIKQSRAQYIFNKVYTEFIGIIIALIGVNAVSFYNHESFSFEFIYCAIFGRLLRQIKIKNKSGASIVFDYYTFSPKQRQMLFSRLASVKT